VMERAIATLRRFKKLPKVWMQKRLSQ
jgi:hypothetical protein